MKEVSPLKDHNPAHHSQAQDLAQKVAAALEKARNMKQLKKMKNSIFSGLASQV
jgi:hypothetical protein